MDRRSALAAAGSTLLLAAGCGTSAPPPRLYQLPLDAPAATQGRRPAATSVWDVSENVSLPAYLDRETVVLMGTDGRVERLADQRWAEPLRDTVPRLLRRDLALLRGTDRIWTAPAPPGVVVARRLRVDILALQADAARAQVRLDARWTLIDPGGRAAPLAGSADLRVPVSGSGVVAIAAAHRLALYQLAEAITASESGSG